MARLANSGFFSQHAVKEAEPVIRRHIEQLCRNLSATIAEGSIVELWVALLAFTTDTISKIAFGSSRGLLGDTEGIKSWHETIIAVAKMTTLLKQFPWMAGLAMKLSVRGFQLVSPALARLLGLHRVRHALPLRLYACA